jgi:hypothetical protein
MLLATLPVSAHHSAFVHFDRNEVIDVTGELVSIDWRNPHTEMTIRTVDEAGVETLWLGQERGVVLLSRKGVTRDMFGIGDTIRIAGFRGRSNRSSLFVTNIMLADGREIYNESFAEQRWDTELAGTTMAEAQAEATRNRPVTPDGLFRVWSTPIVQFAGHAANLDRALWNESYPLTAFAENVRDNWDPVEDNPFIFCQNAMPAIMDQLHPMQFTDEGETIRMRLEELDTVRIIHMNESPGPAQPSGPYGYSTGRWDGGTLVVTTTGIDFPWFDQEGIPQSDELVTVERFTPSIDGFTLNYTLTATDPVVFTEPVVLDRNWTWVPGEEVQPFECSWDGSSLQADQQ